LVAKGEEESMQASDLGEVMRQRRSIREFTGMPVTQGDLDAVIEAASLAPSAMNEQPWLFTVVTNAKVLGQISQTAKAYALRQFSEGPHFDHVRQILGDPHFDIFYGAPALIVISAPASSAWAIEDCALAAQNLMLAAHARGLGTCWIGFSQKWLNSEDGRKAIGLPHDHLAVAPIIVGHPKSTPGATARHKPRIHRIA
jgi:nitroreductase